MYDWFRNRLMVPLVAPGGNVLGFGARTMGDEQPKYLNSPESSVYHKSQFLFALEQARKHVKADGEVIVVEGYFDAIAMHQAGLPQTVATSGTALTADHAKQLRRLARGVALTYDGDAAGQEAMLRSLGVLLSESLDVAVVDLPAGDDPDTLVRRDGIAGWERVRASAYDAVEFVQRHVLKKGGGGDPRERALQSVVRMLAGVPDAIRVRLLIERASQVFALPEGVIARAVAQARTGATPAPGAKSPVAAVVSAQRGKRDELHRQTLRALLHAPDALEWARAELPLEIFGAGPEHELAERLWAGESALGTEEDAASALARELLAHEEPDDYDWEAVGHGNARLMKVKWLERQRRDLRTRMANAGPDDSIGLMTEFNSLSKQILELTR
jgi:DNA primase